MPLVLENGVFLHGADAISHDLTMRNDLYERQRFEIGCATMPHCFQPDFSTTTPLARHEVDTIPPSVRAGIELRERIQEEEREKMWRSGEIWKNRFSRP